MNKSAWEEIINNKGLDWVEWHKEIMSPKFGRCMLKLWLSSDGWCSASIITPKEARYTKTLKAEDIESAKNEAEEWAVIRL